MIGRILFWVALACLVVAAIRTKLRQAKRQQQMQDDPRRAAERVAAQRAAAQAEAVRQAAQQRAGAKAAAQQAGPAEAMLCCAHCGVYFPASEKVAAHGRDYCSQAHAQLAS